MKRNTYWNTYLCAVIAITLMAATGLQAQQRGGSSNQSSGSSSGSGATGDSYTAGRVWDALIEVDPESGSVVIIADDETNEHIKKIIESLDRPVPQVLIKVLFLEVTHRDDLDLGVQASVHTDGEDDGNLFQSAFGLAAETTGGFYRLIEDDIDLTMRAIAEVGKMEVLSRPSILARHNQEATITIGQEVPFIRNSRVTTDGQLINTVEYEDIGIILRVTPFITEEGLVEMVVAPEISTLTGETVPISAGVDAPVFAKRSAETRVVLPDRQTVVIGGLMQEDNTETVRKIPLLGSIPYLGAAFRRTVKENAKTELLIFLTPHVIEGAARLADMTEDEQKHTEFVPETLAERSTEKYFGVRKE